jgi:hypothetical protein
LILVDRDWVSAQAQSMTLDRVWSWKNIPGSRLMDGGSSHRRDLDEGRESSMRARSSLY